jgi:hypothetical protein
MPETYKTIRVKCKCGAEFEASYLPGHRRYALAAAVQAVETHKTICNKSISWLKTETHAVRS